MDQQQENNEKNAMQQFLKIDGQYICEQCRQTFNKKSHLYRHIRETHNQVRTYACSVEGCGKVFKRGSHLKRHMISHTNNKAFKCDQCVMAFGYKHHLDRHIKLIHMKQLPKCQECGQEFLKKKSLAKHLKEHERKAAKEAEKQRKREKKKESQNIDLIGKTTKTDEAIFEDSDSEKDMIYRCPLPGCLYGSDSQQSLKKHIERMHQNKHLIAQKI